MRQYDTTFIIDGTLEADKREALINKFSGSIKKLGGKVDQIVRWGQRNLAYEINKKSQGYYVIFYYTAEPSILTSFERVLRLDESILRFMTVVFDGKHPDYIRNQDIKRSERTYVKPVKETSELPVSIEEKTEEDEDLGETETENEIKTDDIIEVNSVDKNNISISDSVSDESEDETENTIKQEDE